MEKVLVKKRSLRWTVQEIEALVSAIEIRKKSTFLAHFLQR